MRWSAKHLWSAKQQCTFLQLPKRVGKGKRGQREEEIGKDTSRDKRREFRSKSKCLIIGDLQWHFIELANQKGVVYDKRFITLSPAT